MGLKAAVLKMPAWKFFILVVLGTSLLIGVVEELVVDHMFHFANTIVSGFQSEADEDRKDIDEDYDEFKKQQEKDFKEFQEANKSPEWRLELDRKYEAESAKNGQKSDGSDE